jgi:3'-5' exoribonuclease
MIEVASRANEPPLVQLLEAALVQKVTIGQHLSLAAQVTRSDVAVDRRGRPYLTIDFRGTDGTSIRGRMWNCTLPEEQRPVVGSIYLCQAIIERYLDEWQLRIQQIVAAPEIDVALFERSTRRPLGELQLALAELIASLRPSLAALVHTVLSGETYQRFCQYPAARVKHGAVRHGLLAHSIHVATFARSVSAMYGPNGLVCDQDLITAAALLHDVGKTHTLPSVAGAALPESAKYLDHITLGTMMVRVAAERATPRLPANELEALLHAILAHHGQQAWGSPVLPQTAEAWIVHLADYVESQLWAWSMEEETATLVGRAFEDEADHNSTTSLLVPTDQDRIIEKLPMNSEARK